MGSELDQDVQATPSLMQTRRDGTGRGGHEEERRKRSAAFYFVTSLCPAWYHGTRSRTLSARPGVLNCVGHSLHVGLEREAGVRGSSQAGAHAGFRGWSARLEREAGARHRMTRSAPRRLWGWQEMGDGWQWPDLANRTMPSFRSRGSEWTAGCWLDLCGVAASFLVPGVPYRAVPLPSPGCRPLS